MEYLAQTDGCVAVVLQVLVHRYETWRVLVSPSRVGNEACWVWPET